MGFELRGLGSGALGVLGFGGRQGFGLRVEVDVAVVVFKKGCASY